jgi:hypothetical protein
MSLFVPGRTYALKTYNQLRQRAELTEAELPPLPCPPALATEFVLSLPKGATWSVNALLGGRDHAFPVLGGFRREVNRTRQDFSAAFFDLNPDLAAQPDDAPIPAGTLVRARWNHLRRCRVGGRAFYGNWVGNGGTFWWMSRPTNLFDLAGKFHDFAYEVNALTWQLAGQRMPEAFWSRKAKADFLFVAMTRGLARELDPEGRLFRRLADANFDDKPELFRRGDGFINPLVHLPGDWLTLPYSELANRPRPCRIERLQKAPGANIQIPVYETFYPSEVPVPAEDREGLWRSLVARKLPAGDSLVDLENLDEQDGSDFRSASPWTGRISRPAA